MVTRRSGCSLRSARTAAPMSSGGDVAAAGPLGTVGMASAARMARPVVTAMVTCQEMSPSARTRWGDPDPSVSAPITIPVATPRPRM
jgi:hypothetical protein